MLDMSLHSTVKDNPLGTGKKHLLLGIFSKCLLHFCFEVFSACLYVNNPLLKDRKAVGYSGTYLRPQLLW